MCTNLLTKGQVKSSLIKLPNSWTKKNVLETIKECALSNIITREKFPYCFIGSFIELTLTFFPSP